MTELNDVTDLTPAQLAECEHMLQEVIKGLETALLARREQARQHPEDVRQDWAVAALEEAVEDARRQGVERYWYELTRMCAAMDGPGDSGVNFEDEAGYMCRTHGMVSTTDDLFSVLARRADILHWEDYVPAEQADTYDHSTTRPPRGMRIEVHVRAWGEDASLPQVLVLDDSEEWGKFEWDRGLINTDHPHRVAEVIKGMLISDLSAR